MSAVHPETRCARTVRARRGALWRVPGCVALAVLSLHAQPGPAAAPERPARSHPFLIVTREQFPELRRRAAVEPWKTMQADALARAEKGSRTAAYDLLDYVGAAALAYILDEERAQRHAHRVRDAIVDQYAQVTPREDRAWLGVVPSLGSFFVAILALDIVRDALTPAEVARCEAVIATQIFKVARNGSWNQVRLGTHGTWDIYTGTRTTPDDAYYNIVMRQITEDGVSPVTNHYAWERLGGGNSRLSKSGYMDVLEFTGIDRRYYGNERIRRFMRWLFGSSVNGAKEMAIFGDMLPTQDIENDVLHRRVVNFDAEAAGYAAWFLRDRPVVGHILSYIVPRAPLPDPVVPGSRFFANGGAFFRERPDDPAGLHAVLYNIRSNSENHTHFETNGLALSGLGNRLLVNGGRLGPPVQAAPLNNTLTLGTDNHRSKHGGGVVEGFVTGTIDFAAGDAGPALDEATHRRSLLLVHGRPSAPGYFVVIDEAAARAGREFRTYLHPANQGAVLTVTPRKEYVAPIDHYPTRPGTALAIHYATTPDRLTIESVPSAVARVYPDYPNHNRLEAVYLADAAGRRTIVTLLLPHDAERGRPSVRQNVAGDVTITALPGAGERRQDRLFEGARRMRFEADGVTLQAEAALVRGGGDEVEFAFVRHGTAFAAGPLGFEAAEPVTVFLGAEEAVVIAPTATVVTLRVPGADRLRFEPVLVPEETGRDRVRVRLGAGTHRFVRSATP